MERKQKEEKKLARNYKGQRIWKIVAISMIAVFLLLIFGGLIRAYHFRSLLIKATQSQIDFAAKKATEKLQSSGVNASAFEIHSGNKIKKVYDGGVSRNILQVSFVNNTITHIYLIDVNSGEFLLHSETDTYGTWANNKMYEHKNRMRPSILYKR